MRAVTIAQCGSAPLRVTEEGVSENTEVESVHSHPRHAHHSPHLHLRPMNSTPSVDIHWSDFIFMRFSTSHAHRRIKVRSNRSDALLINSMTVVCNQSDSCSFRARAPPICSKSLSAGHGRPGNRYNPHFQARRLAWRYRKRFREFFIAPCVSDC
jgi:hypothetical protein